MIYSTRTLVTIYKVNATAQLERMITTVHYKAALLKMSKQLLSTWKVIRFWTQ